MSDNEPGDGAWHRKPALVFAGGGVALALIVALVVAVVQMSDQWSKPLSPVLTTLPSPPAPTSSRDRQPFVITPDTSSTSFTTSVPVSTTDIGLPGPSETTSGSETPTTSETSQRSRTTTTSRTSGRSGSDDDSEVTTTRKRPRLNQTRTVTPAP